MLEVLPVDENELECPKCGTKGPAELTFVIVHGLELIISKCWRCKFEKPYLCLDNE